jgi:hypothetical protein
MMRLIAALFLSFVALSAFARIVPNKDPLNGVLDAELVVIAGPSLSGKPGIFRIEDVFLGDLHAGDSIDLGDFKLSVVQRYGSPEIEPINPATRILFFLQRAKNSATLWKPTYFEESYFWVQRTEDVALLKRAAERAVNLRRDWEKAAATPDPKLRVAELWPFLSLPTYGVSFLQHTESEFRIMKERPGRGRMWQPRLPGGANQFSGWSCTRRSPAPFTGHFFATYTAGHHHSARNCFVKCITRSSSSATHAPSSTKHSL